MTLKERVIVETYTGYCMTSGEEMNEVYKYMQEIMGRPVYTHELASKEVQQELHEKSKEDFVNLCRNKQPTAYDPEEVVKQLEERLFEMHKLFLRGDRDELKYFYQMQMLKEVIEIVRKGGVKHAEP